jgi:MoaA/NifB/PqqE/SkfB family radical SAM enzyme
MLLHNNNGVVKTGKAPAMPKKLLKGRPDYFILKNEGLNREKPLYLLLNLETGCSYRCPKCALSGERKKDRNTALSLEQRNSIISTAKEIGVKSLVIAGLGEPTEHFPMVRNIIESAHQQALTTILFSTLNGLTVQTAEFLRDHDVSVILSLDSLDTKNYRKLTGNGDLEKVLGNVDLLRQIYRGSVSMLEDKTLVRLGINTTIVEWNKEELDAISKFAGEDMQFIVNPPMKRGRFLREALWKNLIGDSYEELSRLAKERSETGGNSTISDGVCGYFGRGINADTDGELMSCVYAGESVDVIQRNALEMSGNQLLDFYREIRSKYHAFTEKLGYVPPCPVRHPAFSDYLKSLRK